MNEEDADELRDLGAVYGRLYEYLCTPLLERNGLGYTEDDLVNDMVEAKQSIQFTDKNDERFVINSLRFAALLPVLRKKFNRDEERIRGRFGGENRTNNLQRLRWNRYPDDYKKLYGEILSSEKEFFKTHNL